MGKKNRAIHSAEFKKKVALEAIRGESTLNELSTKFKINPNLISKWKAILIEKAELVFTTGESSITQVQEDKIKAPLFEKIGQLHYEVDWLKKKL